MTTLVLQRLDAIRRGRDYLQDHEWIQEDYFELSDDEVPDFARCDVIGAIAAANGWLDEDTVGAIRYCELLDDAIEELNADLPQRYDDIIAFNDIAVNKMQVVDQMNTTLQRLAEHYRKSTASLSGAG